MIASIEGKRGMSRNKPPFPANKGLWGKPTIINNVETLANVPKIVLTTRMVQIYGHGKIPGTKVFALGGKINNTGLVEVPWESLSARSFMTSVRVVPTEKPLRQFRPADLPVDA